jgi:diadenosine tetraphosphate (Ap4A) HIT family hydrolase
MTTNFNNFNEKFKVDDLIIFQTDYWRWSLRPLQCTLGAGILSLKRPAEAMSELTTEEGADLIVIIKIIESTLKKAFNMEKMNYIMLMMVDFHIHYHVVPRYPKDIFFTDVTFKDLGWPKPPILDADVLDMNVLFKIKDYLKSLL